MRRILMGITIAMIFAVGMWGCATTGDMDKMQARQQALDAKTDQAIQDAQAAKAAADEAKLKADAAAARAEEAVKKAEEREAAADQKQKEAEAMFKKSMKK